MKEDNNFNKPNLGLNSGLPEPTMTSEEALALFRKNQRNRRPVPRVERMRKNMAEMRATGTFSAKKLYS